MTCPLSDQMKVVEALNPKQMPRLQRTEQAHQGTKEAKSIPKQPLMAKNSYRINYQWIITDKLWWVTTVSIAQVQGNDEGEIAITRTNSIRKKHITKSIQDMDPQQFSMTIERLFTVVALRRASSRYYNINDDNIAHHSHMLYDRVCCKHVCLTYITVCLINICPSTSMSHVGHAMSYAHAMGFGCHMVFDSIY
jgi:hypothetical protein